MIRRIAFGAALFAAATTLAALPLCLGPDGIPHVAAAFAKDGGGSHGGGGGGHGGGNGGGHSGSSGGSSGGSGSSGGGRSGGGSSGDHGSEHGGGSNRSGDDHGGRNGADDRSGDDRQPGAARRNDDQRRGLEHVSAVTGAKVESEGRHVEITTRDGFREEIEGGRYEMKDPRGRTIVERAATAADRARLSAAAR